MAEKHIVVQGADCKCNFGTAPDKLKVLTHQKEYANDSEGAEKAIASDKDIGVTFEKNSFGSCSKMNNNPCTPTITKWKGFYEGTTLTNGGKVLLEDSLATCPIGGADCIKITKHGQIAEPCEQNFKNANKGIQKVLNPLIAPSDLIDSQPVKFEAIDG